MRKIDLSRLLILSLVFLFIAAACDDEGETYKLSGTITKSGVADGITVSIKLVDEGDDLYSEPLYSAEATFSSNSASYTISGIEAGDYNLFAFINVATGGESSVPDSGDYVTSFDVSINGDKTIDISEDYWIVYQP